MERDLILVHVYFIAFLKYITYILEIEATVYKTFPAEIIDGPASPFFSHKQTGPFFSVSKRLEQNKKKSIKTTNQQKKNREFATLFCPALPL